MLGEDQRLKNLDVFREQKVETTVGRWGSLRLWFGVRAPSMLIVVGKRFPGPGDSLALGVSKDARFPVRHLDRQWLADLKLGRILQMLGHEIDSGGVGHEKRVPNKDRSSKGG